MARAKVRINHAAITSMFVPGGKVYAHAVELERSIHKATKRTTPKRTGYLARSLRTDRVGTQGNGRGCNFRIWTDTEYAVYVLEGTGPIIRSRGPWPMRLYSEPGRRIPPGGAKWVGFRFQWVSGQHANDFMERGLLRGMRRHGYRV